MGQLQQVIPFVPRIVERSDVSIATSIAVANRPRPIVVVNLSSHGFMGHCPAGVPLGSRVRIDLPGLGEMQACVRWAVGKRVGGRFDTPLDPAQLADALTAAGPV